MTQLTITLNTPSARILKRAAKKKAKPFEEYAKELLEWYAMRAEDPLFTWTPRKNSGKGIKDSGLNHDKYLYKEKH